MNAMTSLLRGLIGSGGQAEESTGVETVRGNLLNHRSMVESYVE